jgi:hypothetical protein
MRSPSRNDLASCVTRVESQQPRQPRRQRGRDGSMAGGVEVAHVDVVFGLDSGHALHDFDLVSGADFTHDRLVVGIEADHAVCQRRVRAVAQPRGLVGPADRLVCAGEVESREITVGGRGRQRHLEMLDRQPGVGRERRDALAEMVVPERVVAENEQDDLGPYPEPEGIGVTDEDDPLAGPRGELLAVDREVTGPVEGS